MFSYEQDWKDFNAYVLTLWARGGAEYVRKEQCIGELFSIAFVKTYKEGF